MIHMPQEIYTTVRACRHVSTLVLVQSVVYDLSGTQRTYGGYALNGLTFSGINAPKLNWPLTIGAMIPRGFRTISTSCSLGGRENSNLSTRVVMTACISMRANLHLSIDHRQ